MSKIESVRKFINECAIEFGAKTDEYNKSFIERKNIGQDALNDNGAYFGFVQPEEELSGPYHDFSFVIFPTDQQDKAWLVCFGVGSSGFKNDYNLATYPGVRRLFSNLVDHNGFCKSDFADIQTRLPKSFTSRDEILHLRKTIDKYSSVLSVCQIVEDPTDKIGKAIIRAYVAAYAKLRDWPSNKAQREAVTMALEKFIKRSPIDETGVILDLVEERKYIVLQGSPGTGKTRTAKEIGKKLKASTFFTQFHAETSYSDFIYGIRPNISNGSVGYSEKLGIFTEAVKFALGNSEKNVLLIVDEINRANLSNVLGQVFYLFEHKMDISNVEIELYPGFKIAKLPENLFVIATMNTADRSLAVVDFALRRRFAWYTLKPKSISGKSFYGEDFLKFKQIFDWYANDIEFSLQPGQGYFIANDEEEMDNRILYELYPLVKEYLKEGLLTNAKEEFNTYFVNRIGKSLSE